MEAEQVENNRCSLHLAWAFGADNSNSLHLLNAHEVRHRSKYFTLFNSFESSQVRSRYSYYSFLTN